MLQQGEGELAGGVEEVFVFGEADAGVCVEVVFEDAFGGGEVFGVDEYLVGQRDQDAAVAEVGE